MRWNHLVSVNPLVHNEAEAVSDHNVIGNRCTRQ
jgi:hypothetical protein